MIVLEAIANAQMHATLSADGASLGALERAVRASCAVPSLLSMYRVMISHQRDACIGSSACLHCMTIVAEQLHQRVHELFSKIELSRSILADPPQLEGRNSCRKESGESAWRAACCLPVGAANGGTFT